MLPTVLPHKLEFIVKMRRSSCHFLGPFLGPPSLQASTHVVWLPSYCGSLYLKHI